MNDTIQTSWLKRRKDFSWLSERDQLIADLRERKKRGQIELDKYGNRQVSRQTPVEEVVAFAKVARSQPEIWGAVNGIVERYRRDPSAEVTKDEIHFFGFFREWYVLKHNLAYPASNFIAVDGLLLKVAHGWIKDDLESDEARAILLTSPFVKES